MKYTTEKGDTWDKIAYTVYGNETFTAPIIAANQKYVETAIFDFGTELDIPELEKTDSTVYLPPWRQ